jgi:hypothetical protein
MMLLKIRDRVSDSAGICCYTQGIDQKREDLSLLRRANNSQRTNQTINKHATSGSPNILPVRL